MPPSTVVILTQHIHSSSICDYSLPSWFPHSLYTERELQSRDLTNNKYVMNAPSDWLTMMIAERNRRNVSSHDSYVIRYLISTEIKTLSCISISQVAIYRFGEGHTWAIDLSLTSIHVHSERPRQWWLVFQLGPSHTCVEQGSKRLNTGRRFFRASTGYLIGFCVNATMQCT